MLKVVGLGDNVVDHYVDTNIIYPGGNALNFSVFAKMSGCEAAYLGSFGTDHAGKYVMSVLQALGVDISMCRQIQGENGRARVKIVQGERIFLEGNRGGVMREHPLRLSSNDLEYLCRFDLVHSSCYSYLEGELGKVAASGVPISYDFSTRGQPDYLREVCPHVEYAFFSAPAIGSEDEVRTMLRDACGMGPRVCMATMGAKGAMLYDGSCYYTQSAAPVEVVDTMGAGDAFITTFLLHYMEWRLRSPDACQQHRAAVIRSALQKAATAAAAACRTMGTFGYGAPDPGFARPAADV